MISIRFTGPNSHRSGHTFGQTSFIHRRAVNAERVRLGASSDLSDASRIRRSILGVIIPVPVRNRELIHPDYAGHGSPATPTPVNTGACITGSTHALATGNPSAPVPAAAVGRFGENRSAPGAQRPSTARTSPGRRFSGSGSCPKNMRHPPPSRSWAPCTRERRTRRHDVLRGELAHVDADARAPGASRYRHFLTLTTVDVAARSAPIVSLVVGPNIHSAASDATVAFISRIISGGIRVCIIPDKPGSGGTPFGSVLA